MEKQIEVTTDDYVAVSQLLSLYGHLFDGKNWQDLDQVFVTDCIVDYQDSGRDRVVGLGALRKHMQDHPPTVISHMSTNLFVWREDSTLKARSKFIAPLPDGTTMSGLYEDVLRETPAGWRLVERVVRLRRSVDDTF